MNNYLEKEISELRKEIADETPTETPAEIPAETEGTSRAEEKREDPRVAAAVPEEKPAPPPEPKPRAVAKVDKTPPPPKPKPRSKPKTNKRKKRRKKPVAAAPVEEKGFGTLDVGVSGGWAFVYIDNAKIRTTPLLNYQIKAGKHKVELRDGEGRVVRRWNIRLRASERVKLLHQ